MPTLHPEVGPTSGLSGSPFTVRRWTAGILKTYCNEVARSVYCKVQDDTRNFINAYLPHSGWSHLHYTAAVHQHTEAVVAPLPTGCTAHRTWFGMDANAVIGRGREADPETHIPPFCFGRRSLRGADLVQWCFEKGLCVFNGTENLGADLVTHIHWSTKVRSQIEYVLVDQSTLPHLILANLSGTKIALLIISVSQPTSSSRMIPLPPTRRPSTTRRACMAGAAPTSPLFIPLSRRWLALLLILWSPALLSFSHWRRPFKPPGTRGSPPLLEMRSSRPFSPSEGRAQTQTIGETSANRFGEGGELFVSHSVKLLFKRLSTLVVPAPSGIPGLASGSLPRTSSPIAKVSLATEMALLRSWPTSSRGSFPDARSSNSSSTLMALNTMPSRLRQPLARNLLLLVLGLEIIKLVLKTA